MELYTVQMAQWRKLKDTNIELIDTTVKSNTTPFAPTWDLVLGYKSGEFTEEFYREQYIDMMRRSYYNNKDHWLWYLQKEQIALGCMCPAGKFCHRHILKEIFVGLGRNLNIPVVDKGEFGHVGT